MELQVILLVSVFALLQARPTPLNPNPIGGFHPLLQVDTDTVTATATIEKNGTVTITPGLAESGTAWVEFIHSLNSTGWSILNIRTSANYTDTEQSYAAGFLEGLVSAADIYDTQANLFDITFPNVARNQVPDQVLQFMNDQEQWTRDQFTKNQDDPFWRHVGYLYHQYAGLEAGYRMAVKDNVVADTDHFAFQLLNNLGDLFQIIPSVMPKLRIPWLELESKKAIDLHIKRGHCSGIVKLTGDFSDLFMSHSSWFYFSNTNRIYKHYSFSFSDEGTKANRVSFSSYPGFLESLDDFYLMSSGLGMIQTSNEVMDTDVLDLITPHSLLAWQRVRVASWVASTGEEWYNAFKTNHSGTYANQYMIVDFKLFTPNRPLLNNTLWVIEEIPGLAEGADQTQILKYGYWPSYNIPFYESIYSASGYPAMEQSHGNYFSYQLAPRAEIFRRDQTNVTDMDSLKILMRSNNYKTDPYSNDGTSQNAMYAICSRGDLNEDQTFLGCYDTKTTSYLNGAMDLQSSAYNGPTTNGGTYKPFSWEEAPSMVHWGLPSEYNFGFVDTKPKKWTN